MNIETMVAALASAPAERLIAAWISVSLKGSALIAVAWLLTRAIRRGSAAMRHAIWTSALAGMLLLPVLTALVPVIELGVMPEIRLPRTPSVERPFVAPEAILPRETGPRDSKTVRRTTSAPAMRELESVAAAAAPRTQIPVEAWLALALFAGVALLVARAVAGAFQLSMWARRARAVHDAGWLSLVQRLANGMGIARPVTLLRSDRACVPMTWGVVYPRVLLPADADAWTADRRTIVLLHELAHVKRLDAFTQFVAQVSVAAFWFNPIVWFAARQMRLEREHACDDFVLDAGARASDYAQDLLQIARSLVTSGAPAAAALAMARRTELEGRLLAILNPRVNRRPASRKRILSSSLGVIALAIPLAALRPVPRMPDPVSKPTPAVILSRQPMDVILSREATKGSLSIQGFNDPGAKAILSSPIASLRLPQDDATGPTASLRPPQHEARRQADTPVPTPASELPQGNAPGPVAVVPTAQNEDLRRALTPLPPARQLEFKRPTTGKAPPDLETLIAVTRAARKLTSDNDKAELLLTVAKYYVSDDELRTVYLDAVASMTSDYERTRTLKPLLLKDSLPMKAVAQVVRIAAMMTSDNDKANLVVRTVMEHAALTPPIRAALIAAAATMTSDYERGRSIAAIARRGVLSSGEAIDLINAAKPMTSSDAKANALLIIAAHHSLDDAEVRRAYLRVAETISSAYDYRRAVVRALQ